MEALAVTLFCSLLLAGFFVVMFLGNQRGRRLGDEQESLLPLDDDFLPPQSVISHPVTRLNASQESPVPSDEHQRS
jgi:hypothetical protein